jgi:hypothetical protein
MRDRGREEERACSGLVFNGRLQRKPHRESFVLLGYTFFVPLFVLRCLGGFWGWVGEGEIWRGDEC